ncbi:MAG: class GN sortase [Halioglobus sp.]
MRPRPASRRRLDGLIVALLLLALAQGAGALSIKAKAWLAPLLIENAWRASLAAGGAPVKPWSWADTWPVARLQAPDQGVERFILAGDSGHALAFGPGHSLASAPPGSAGLAVIGGHRDTHFAFLETVTVGTRLDLQLPNGEWRTYRVAATRVVDATRERLSRAARSESLLLVTCYPFNAIAAGGPLRFTVLAEPEPQVAGLL